MGHSHHSLNDFKHVAIRCPTFQRIEISELTLKWQLSLPLRNIEGSKKMKNSFLFCAWLCQPKSVHLTNFGEVTLSSPQTIQK
jgi:hypothetical protein